MEKTVYYLCKETLRMNETGEVAFTKGLFYKLVKRFDWHDGVIAYEYIDDLGKTHTLTKDFKKKHMVKAKDKNVARILEKGASQLSGTYYMCKKTMEMRVTGEVAFKKGKVYRLADVDDLAEQKLFYMDSDYVKEHQMTQKGMNKYLVKIIDRSVLEEQ